MNPSHRCKRKGVFVAVFTRQRRQKVIRRFAARVLSIVAAYTCTDRLAMIVANLPPIRINVASFAEICCFGMIQ